MIFGLCWKTLILFGLIIIKSNAYAKIVSNVTLTEYVIKTRYINLCDATINANKRYTAQVFEKIRMNNREEEIHGYVYVPQNQKIVKGVLNPGIWKGSGYQSIFNRTSRSPCSDPLLSIPLFKSYHADLNCNIKKGNYTINGLFPNKLAHLALGDKYAPGRSRVLLKYASKNALFYCIEVIVDIVPLGNSNATKFR